MGPFPGGGLPYPWLGSLSVSSPPRSARGPGGLLRKAFLATALGLPLAAGVTYAAAEKRERRKMRLLLDGGGRFVR